MVYALRIENRECEEVKYLKEYDRDIDEREVPLFILCLAIFVCYAEVLNGNTTEKFYFHRYQ